MTFHNEKSRKVVSQAESAMGWPYVFGAWGEACTPGRRKSRARSDHPTIISKCQVLSGKTASCDGCKWQGALMFDCRGFTFWCLKTGADILIQGQGATSQYNTASNWVKRGAITHLPDCVCCVFQQTSAGKMQHTGLHIGGGKIIHCSNGVQTGTAGDKAWTHYAIPRGLYTEDDIKQMEEVHILPTLKRGSKGDDVRTLQEQLTRLGYSCGTIDGVFGTLTGSAVKDFQADHDLTVDGTVGEATWAAIQVELNRQAEPAPVEETTESAEETTESAETAADEWRQRLFQVALASSELTTNVMENMEYADPDGIDLNNMQADLSLHLLELLDSIQVLPEGIRPHWDAVIATLRELEAMSNGQI